MVKTTPLLIISGILVVIGISISYIQSENELGEIATSQQTVPAGDFMNVSKSLDPAKSTAGVFSIQISDFKSGEDLSTSVLGPSGSTVLSTQVTKSPVQENFTVTAPGTYELKIQNTAQSALEVTGIIGYYPQGPTLVDVFSIIVLILGLSGLAIGMMYFIKGRGRLKS